MKIFFINSLETDYLQDLTFQGLVQVLGKENVRDFPWNKNYHLPLKKYPKNLGYHSKYYFFPKFSVKQADYVFIGAAKPDCFQNYLKIIPKISENTKIVFLDGGDFSKLGGDLERLKAWELYQQAIRKRPADIIFKREMLLDKKYPEQVFPLVFSSPLQQIPTALGQQYKYDVSFWAVESDPIRTKALELIENKFDCKENGSTRNQVFSKYKRKGKFYLEELAACRIVLNFRGVGWDTLRYWETPALGKPLMISQKPKIQIPNNFEDKKHVVFCKDDLSDLIELCEYYLANEKERLAIAQAGKIQAQKYHSSKLRAKYILEILENL